MFARGKDMRGAVLILLVALSAMLAMPVHVAYADADGTGADGAGQGIQADADGKNPSEGESQDGQGSEVPGELGRPGMDGESPDGSSDPADPVKPADPADPPDGSGDAGGPEAPADGSAGPAPAEAPAGPAGDPAGPAADAAPPAASPSLPENDSPDGSAYRGATLRRTPLYASPDASQPEADFLWGGVVVGGFTRWDAAGEWLAVAYGGGRYFARASDVSLNDGSGSRVAVTLSRTPAYEAPDASLPEAEFFWGGVSLSAAAWDAAGEWLVVSYRGATYFLRSEALSSADAADRGARLGVTLRRTDLYASPDDSQAPADFFWGGVVLSGFSRWDAAGEWLTIVYAGQRYYAKASDVSLADAPDRAAYRGVTLRRTDLYASPDDSQAPADFFWGGVVLSGFSRWDAAGGWLAVAYAGQTLFAKASDVSLNDAPGRDAPYVGRTLGRVSMYPAPDLSSEPFDFFWGGVEVPAAPWDAAGEWVLSSYRGQAAFLPADSVELVLADPMVRKAQDYTSITPYLILVDTAEHKVGVFSGSGNGGWRRIHFWDCADGAPATPTVKGSFTVGIRGYYFDSSNARCFYYTQFYGNYLFHSTLYYQYPTPSHPMDSRLGMALSHGCVRLQLDNAKWIYDNIPWGTKVVVY